MVASSLPEIPNVGTYVPSIGIVKPYTELFQSAGPYLAAILLVFLGISLCAMPAKIFRILGLLSFALGVATGGIAIWAWSGDLALRRDPSIKYVVRARVEAHEGLASLIAKIEVPTSVQQVAESFASTGGTEDEVFFIVISDKPITEDTVSPIYIYVKGASEPQMACISGLKQMHDLRWGKASSVGDDPDREQNRLLQLDQSSGKWIAVKPDNCIKR